MATKQLEHKIVVRNFEQSIIFMHEMAGQISDGQWENSSPRNHWHWVSDVDWDTFVIDAEAELGSTMHQHKVYNFANKELLDIVSGRIIFSIKLYKLYPEVWKAFQNNHWGLPESLEDYGSTVRSAKDAQFTGTYWKEQYAAMESAGLTAAVVEAVAKSDCYTIKDLRKDCAELKKSVVYNWNTFQALSNNGYAVRRY